MGKADRVLELLPAFYRATDRHKLLRGIVGDLAAPLERFDTDLFRIQRAHRITVAEHVEDIVRLAATMNLTPFHFEDLVDQAAVAYGVRIELLRDRVKRLVRLHLQGLGTAWAALETTAVFLNADIVPRAEGEPRVRHLDADGYSHEIFVRFPRAEGTPRERVYLHENPFRRRKVEPAPRWQGDGWAVENANPTSVSVRIAIEGVGDRTVLPMVYSPHAQEGIVFNGIVRDGETLVIDSVEGASIGDHPVDDWLIYFRGGVWDGASFDSGRMAVSRGETDRAPFSGDPEEAFTRPFERRRPVPSAPVGRSEWTFRVTEGIWDGCRAGYAVYAFPDEPVGEYEDGSSEPPPDGSFNFDECVFDLDPSAVAGMAWDERMPCSFKLLLPARIPPFDTAATETLDPSRRCSPAAPPAPAREVNVPGRVASMLPRVKAAGIRAYVDTAADAWIVGESVIRDDAAADGEGVEYHSTRVHNQGSDAFVPFDTDSASR